MKQKRKLKFIIFAPRNNRGGSIVLKNLCKNLIACGYDASLFISNGIPAGRKNLSVFKLLVYLIIEPIIDQYREWQVRRKGREWYKDNPKYRDYIDTNYDGIPIKRSILFSRKTIIVYPDTVFGNPIFGRNIVRYFLYYNRYSDTPNAYGEKDLFICFREQFNDYFLNPKCLKLTMSYFDLDLYKRTNFENRSGKCYIIRKGKNRDDLPKEYDGVIIDDLCEEDIVKVFNSSEYCISYDTQTAYSTIAALCGCISVVIPEKGKGWKDYKKDEDVKYGIAYGFDESEIEYAKKTANKVRPLLEQRNQQAVENTKRFVDICDDYFF